MPEGHTIHRLALDHRRALAGGPVSVSSPQGRFTDAARSLDERVLEGVEAYGKHLFYDFGGGDLIHVHLGLFGRFVHHAPPPPMPRETVRLRMSGLNGTWDLIGATECALIDPAVRQAIFARLGPDPLRRDADPEAARCKLQRRRTPVGVALLDQSVIAGVGNVYRAEILHVHGIHPETPADAVGREQFDSIWSTLVGWMRHGLQDQVIITVDPKEVGKPRSRITKGEALWVYKQQRCRRCGGEVRRWDLAGRWAYACESCQPPQRPR
ncbi:MAG: Fpg/Nei family DNA glycosylase [Actinobacteria bacterium]|nr:Fpg/Nei family DNA glycosylase [Actinomycetota bacterium]MBW3650655.1 Fpg/Nei family DNA glycosylase [Actinomycetota bacterium]